MTAIPTPYIFVVINTCLITPKTIIDKYSKIYLCLILRLLIKYETIAKINVNDIIAYIFIPPPLIRITHSTTIDEIITFEYSACENKQPMLISTPQYPPNEMIVPISEYSATNTYFLLSFFISKLYYFIIKKYLIFCRILFYLVKSLIQNIYLLYFLLLFIMNV